MCDTGLPELSVVSEEEVQHILVVDKMDLHEPLQSIDSYFPQRYNSINKGKQK